MAEEIKEVKEKKVSTSGELADSELENVSGGLKIKVSGGKAVMVTRHTHCFTGEYKNAYDYSGYDGYGGKKLDKDSCTRDNSDGKLGLRKFWADCCTYGVHQCGTCYHLEFKGGLGYCGKSIK